MAHLRSECLFAVVLLSVSCGALVGCSDDGGTGQDDGDGGGDAIAHDGGADGGLHFDGGGDATTGDDGSTPDGSMVDGTSPTDASHVDASVDASESDSSVDASGSDSSSGDAAADAAAPDAAPIDAGSDAASPADAGNDANSGDAGITCSQPTDCPATGNECIAATCNGNTCGTMFVSMGTATATQTQGDCKTRVCDGVGGTSPSVNDNDLPTAASDCVTPTCTNGAASTPPKMLNTPCGTGGTNICDGNGACVQCVVATTCPGVDNECQTRTCSAGACGFSFVAPGTPAATQVAGNCHTFTCDGAGNDPNLVDDADKPVDNNDCTNDVCTGGVATNPPLTTGSACNQNGGTVCDANATCSISVHVVRVGDGSAALTSAATATFLEARFGSDGTLVPTAFNNPNPLPTAVNGSNARLTLSGSATSEGALALSTNGHYVTLGGYDAATTTAGITGATAAAVNRIVARVDAAGTIDTTTKIDSTINGGNIRSAVTTDGTAFWVGGSTGGVAYIAYGATGGASILAIPANARVVNIFGGQLFGSAASGTSPNNYFSPFLVGTGLPTMSPNTATVPTGFPTATASPYAYAFFDLNANVAGLDTAYVADDRATASGGGVQKWTFNGTSWSLLSTLNNGITVGVRGLAAQIVGANVVIFATTTTSALVRFVDDGSPSPAATVLATAGINTAYRGVAISPR